ncbi:hypothetical protein TEA_012493 [Camellia sinensis var. sinensis]|uniref:Glycosyl hydrolase family 32 C-terminal domain-containing protein n=1 Tax=Camellia sinensis var. sinensis TaxID=542762 RepID=A0A4S4F068_CAMSN|nr:hypothetical protein TEA_012493 [Camellia sinensis var. sinensis]
MKWTKAQHPLRSSAMTEWDDLVGCANETDTSVEDVKKDWAGIQADVEVTFSFLSLDKAEPFDPSWVNMDAQELCGHKGSTIPGFLKAKDKHAVLMCSDATSSSLKKKLYRPSFAGFLDVDLADNKLSLQSLIDNSVAESFEVGGKTCIITSKVYTTLAVFKDAHLYAFNNGTETVTIENLDAGSMNYPLMN